MKLISLHIAGFGGLSGDYTFDNLTCIYEKNGYGKTTLAAFVKAMFYGLSTTKAGSTKYDDRQRYLPFDLKKFGGSLTFESDEGKRLTIERYFDNKSERLDTVKLFDGLSEVRDFDADLGKTYFGVDEKTFMRTIFIDDNEIANLSDIGASLAEVVDDTDNYERAVKKIDDELTSLKAKRGKGGRINLLSYDILLLEERKGYLERLGEEISLKRVDIKNLKAERDGLTVSFVKAGEKERYKVYDEFLSEIEALKTKIELILSKYPKGIVEGEAWEKLDDLCASVRENRSKQAAIVAKIERGQSRRTASDYVVLLAYILAAGCLIGGVAAALLLGIGVAAISLWSVCLVLFVVARATMMFKRSQLSSLKGEEVRLLHLGQLLLEGFELSGDVLEVAAEIKSDRLELETSQKELDIRMATAEKYKRDNDLKDEPIEETPPSDEDRDERFRRIDEKLIKVNGELSVMEREIIDLDEVLSELNKKRAELDECKVRYERLTAVLEALKRAEDNLKERYINPIFTSFDSYKQLLERLEIRAKLTNNLELVLDDSGTIRRCEHLSKGQLQALSLALRLALADNLYRNAFIILDDPFVSLDEEHLVKVKDLLVALAKKRQIIYFTCHKSRAI